MIVTVHEFTAGDDREFTVEMRVLPRVDEHLLIEGRVLTVASVRHLTQKSRGRSGATYHNHDTVVYVK